MSRTQDSSKQDERAKRLAEALRANLRKRKLRDDQTLASPNPALDD